MVSSLESRLGLTSYYEGNTSVVLARSGLRATITLVKGEVEIIVSLSSLLADYRNALSNAFESDLNRWYVSDAIEAARRGA